MAGKKNQKPQIKIKGSAKKGVERNVEKRPKR